MAKKGKEVILRQYDDSHLQTAFSLLRKTKIFLEDSLDFEEDPKKGFIWIFVVKNTIIPEEEI